MQLENVTLLPSVFQKEFKTILAEVDVGLFSLHRTHNFPGKLLGYIVQVLPILGSINPENDLKETVEDAEAGFITINGEDDLFYQNACKLLDPVARKEIGNNAKKLLHEKFSVAVAAEQIISTIQG